MVWLCHRATRLITRVAAQGLNLILRVGVVVKEHLVLECLRTVLIAAHRTVSKRPDEVEWVVLGVINRDDLRVDGLPGAVRRVARRTSTPKAKRSRTGARAIDGRVQRKGTPEMSRQARGGALADLVRTLDVALSAHPPFVSDQAALTVTHYDNPGIGPNLRRHTDFAVQQRYILLNIRPGAWCRLTTVIAIEGEAGLTLEVSAESVTLVAKRNDDRALRRDCVEHVGVRVRPREGPVRVVS